MNLRPIASLAYVLLIVAAIVSLFFVYILKPTSAEATALFGIWLLLPYIILAAILAFSTRAIDVANLVVTLFVVVGGLLFLVVVIFIRPDPQGGIAVFFTPMYQGVAMVVLIPLSRWIFGKWGA